MTRQMVNLSLLVFDDAGGEGFMAALLLAGAALVLLGLTGSFGSTLFGVLDRVTRDLPG